MLLIICGAKARKETLTKISQKRFTKILLITKAPQNTYEPLAKKSVNTAYRHYNAIKHHIFVKFSPSYKNLCRNQNKQL
jgi:hypothetical protein